MCGRQWKRKKINGKSNQQISMPVKKRPLLENDIFKTGLKGFLQKKVIYYKSMSPRLALGSQEL
jgi:hypothetical protein